MVLLLSLLQRLSLFSTPVSSWRKTKTPETKRENKMKKNGKVFEIFESFWESMQNLKQKVCTYNVKENMKQPCHIDINKLSSFHAMSIQQKEPCLPCYGAFEYGRAMNPKENERGALHTVN